MTKSELIAALADEIDLDSNQIRDIVKTILDAMSEALGHGERVELRGLGSFSVRQHGSYAGRNPKTGAVVKVQPKKLPFFKISKNLQEAVDRNK